MSYSYYDRELLFCINFDLDTMPFPCTGILFQSICQPFFRKHIVDCFEVCGADSCAPISTVDPFHKQPDDSEILKFRF